MQKHFVIFQSPGTFVFEQSEREIGCWSVDEAVSMARGVKERYGATPFSFHFITRSRSDNDLDSKITDKSCTYFLGGDILTLQQIKDKNDPNDEILIWNMENNGWNRVVVNTNSYKTVVPLGEEDVVLNY